MFVCGECGASQPAPGHCGADGAALVLIDDPLLGSMVGPYRVARLMGVGGMGRVYKGVHPQIGSRVAIKVLSRECTDRRDLVERFFAEAKAANLIRHEGIVNVLGDGASDLQPEQRFASAQAMSNALQHATATLPGDQWEPILPSRASRPSSPAAWAPTPPASWAGSGARTGQRPDTPLTQTAGQVAHLPVQKSSKKLWLALGGVALVGGAIAVAAIAGGGDGKHVMTQTQTGSGSGSGSAVAVVDMPVADAAVAEVIPPAPPAADGELSAAEAKRMDDMLANTIDALDPEDAVMFPPEVQAAIKKYGGWSKIPKAERMKLLRKATASLGAGGLGSFDVLGGALDTPAPSLKDEHGWLKPSTSLAFPGSFDATQLNVPQLLTWAVGQAKDLYPDAVLYRFGATNVAANGIADISGSPVRMIDFRFITPSRANGQCAFMIAITARTSTTCRRAERPCGRSDPRASRPRRFPTIAAEGRSRSPDELIRKERKVPRRGLALCTVALEGSRTPIIAPRPRTST